MDKVKILLVGIGGYGVTYVNGLLDEGDLERVNAIEIVGVVDPYANGCQRFEELKKRGIPFYLALEDFYKERKADLAIISTPIYMHAPQICYCLARGSNVLCEKPLCGSYEEGLQVIEAEKESGKFVGIGYQLSYLEVIQQLKKDIQSGIYGKALRLKAICCGARDEKYYNRNNWAGKIRTSDGKWVCDSPINNACAHHLHNMFYILGDLRETSAAIAEVTAELYKGNPDIENFDTAAIRCKTTKDTEILFYSTHAIAESKYGNVFTYEFENAIIEMNPQHKDVYTVTYKDGSIKSYAPLPEWNNVEKLWQAVNCIRTGELIACGPKAAITQTICISTVYESSKINSFPKELVTRVGEKGSLRTDIKDLEDCLLECYNENKLPGEIGYTWAKQGKLVIL